MLPIKHSETPANFSLGTYEVSDHNGVILSTETDRETVSLSSSGLLSPSLDSKIVVTEFSERVEDGKSIAMSMQQPRLTVNGKRVGRPPGTFRNQTAMKSPIPKKQKLPKCLISPAKVDKCLKACQALGDMNLPPKKYQVKIKPFKCRLEGCDKTFKSIPDLEKHENRTHSNKRNFVCDVAYCKKAYTDPSSLRKHILQIHGREALEIRKKSRTPVAKSPALGDPMLMYPIPQFKETTTVHIPPPIVLDSAFSVVIPLRIQHVLKLMGLMNIEQQQIVAAEYMGTQEFVRFSHDYLSKVLPRGVTYRPCECISCLYRYIVTEVHKYYATDETVQE
ncbi:unnamed protein product [Caenorhabditis brenneri]